MLLLGKTLYRNQPTEGTGGKVPIEINLGTVEIEGDTPTKADLARAINDRPPFTVLPDRLPVFKVRYIKVEPN